jgi:hypothetical protein
MGLENLLLVVSHWNSGAIMGKLRHPSLVHFSFQCLNSFLENMRWNRICSEANLRYSKIIWVSQLGSPLAGFRIVIGFEHTQHAMAQGGVNRLGTELFKRGTSKELKRKSQFLGPPASPLNHFYGYIPNGYKLVIPNTLITLYRPNFLKIIFTNLGITCREKPGLI